MVGFDRSQPVLVQTVEPVAEETVVSKPVVRRVSGVVPLVCALVLGAFWMSAATAYFWGYFGPKGLAALEIQVIAVLSFTTLVPPMLFIACAWAFTRGLAMTATADALSEGIEKLFSADETASRTSARLGRVVRRELDALNAGLDGAFARLRALEGVLESNIAALDEAGARADVRAESVAARLTQERDRIDQVTGSLTESASRASEIVAGRFAQERERMDQAAGSLSESAARASELFAGRLSQERDRIDQVASSLTETASRASELVAGRFAQERERMDQVAVSLADNASRASELIAGRMAQLKSTMQTAEGSLKQAGTQLDTHAANFRTAAEVAAQAPHSVAIELDKQAKAIENASDTAISRSEFVLGRHERHRTSMGELLQRLTDETAKLEGILASQTASLDKATTSIKTEAKRFEGMVGETDRQLDLAMANATSRATQLAQSFTRESEKTRDVSEAATATLARLVDSMRDAGLAAQLLIGETNNEAKKNAKALVGDAMGECERLLRIASELSTQAKEIRTTLGTAVSEVEKHLLMLPSLAQQEASRVRDTVRSETEQMLDLSARTISTLHARNAVRNGLRPAAPGEPEPEPQPNEGLIGMARRLTQRTPKPKPAQPQQPAQNADNKSWNMRTLLAAVETEESGDKNLKPGAAAALGALQTALADIAVDLDAIVGGEAPTDEEWKQYLAGDRSLFARKLADSINADTVERVCALYRENAKFRDAANVYLAEFEGMLARAQEGDGDGLLASSLLAADTGKIYLAVAYALGRLS